MILVGAIANSVAVLFGGLIGFFFKKGIPDRFGNLIMNGLGLFTIALGISFFLKSQNMIIVVLSIVMGSILGEWLDIDKRLEVFGDNLQKRSRQTNADGFSKGFVTASLMFCVGSMAIMGSLQSGLLSNHEILYTKSIIDGISALILSSAFGIGVVFSAIPLFIYQGSIVLLASFISPYINNAVVNEMTAVGGILLIGLSFMILDIKKIKVSNMVPAILVPVVIMLLYKI